MKPFNDNLSAEEREEFEIQLREHTERYHPYCLSFNPFPLGGNYPESYLPYTHLNPTNEARINDFLFSTFMREEFNGLLIRGEYGSGKSHMLYFARNMVQTNPFFGKQALGFLINNPSVAPEDILLSMLREVKLGVVQDLVFAPVAQSLKDKYDGEVIPFLKDFTNFGRSLFDDHRVNPFEGQDVFGLSFREFAKLFDDNKVTVEKGAFQAFAREALSQKTKISDQITEDLIQLILAREPQNSRSWEAFISSRLMSSKKGTLGVEYYLEAFLQLFKYSGIRHIYLLVDELEDLRTVRLSPKAAVEYLATLRKMIQHNYRMFSLVLACTRDAWDELLALYPAIQDRFPIVIDLLPSNEDYKEVVKKYLNEARIEGQAVPDPWFPFTEAAIDEVINKRGGVIRHVLTDLRSVLDAAARGSVGPEISAAFVRSTLAQ
jgi:hypothetical protein